MLRRRAIKLSVSFVSKDKPPSYALWICIFLAFPSVGCGQLGFDPSIIAKHMIDETQTQLKTLNSKMDVSFILLSSQQNVYDEFVKYLNSTQPLSATTSKIPATSKTNSQLKIEYDEKSKNNFRCFLNNKFFCYSYSNHLN
jgi:hypothetical protein